MEFNTFRTACKYAGIGYDQEIDSIENTCRRKDRIPDGSSWGICKEDRCPYFGVVANNVTIYCEGKEVAKAESIRFVIDQT